VGDFQSFVIADIPGLIEGAHKGVGLGDRFLKHIERSKILVHLVDISEGHDRDPADDIRVINNELISYNEDLGKKTQIIVGNKIDRASSQKSRSLEFYCKKQGDPCLFISALTGQGTKGLVEYIWKILSGIEKKEAGQKKR
jgi:GTP-binding protein